MTRPISVDTQGQVVVRLSADNLETIKKIKKKNSCNTSEAVRFALEYINLVIDAQ